MADIENLKRLAEHADKEVIRSNGWDGMVEDAGFLRSDEQYVKAANPAAILALIAENEGLTQHNEFLAGAPDRFAASLRAVADALDLGADRNVHADCVPAIAKLRAENEALKDEVEEDAAVIDKLAKLLAGVAVALKGEELPLHRHSYHDLPEGVQALKAELERVRADAERLRKHLAECADSLESEILDRYGLSKDHPAMRRKFECDMQDVIDARAAMGKGGRADV